MKNTKTRQNKPEDEKKMILTPHNYMLILIGVVIIIVGLVLMAGGGSADPNVFDYGMFSFRRITLAPVIILAGFAFIIYAIMKLPKSRK